MVNPKQVDKDGDVASFASEEADWRVNFTLNRGDLLRASFYHAPRMAALQIMAGIVIVWQTWKFIQAASRLDVSPLARVLTFVVMEFGLLLAIGVATTGALILLTLLTYVPSKNKNILTQYQVSAAPSGLRVETRHNLIESKWGGVVKVVRNRDYIFVYLSQHGAHIIPRRAFPGREQSDAFYAYVLERRKSSRDG
jgi:hypothetical protein